MLNLLVQSLVSNGLNILGNAVLAKGKEAIEEKLGIDIESATKTEEGLLALKQAEMQHEEFLLTAAIKQKELDIQAEAAAQSAVTSRWQADMLSDSWLSKNIRPLVLIFLLSVYTIFSVLSGFGFAVTQSYVELLAQMLMLVTGAYFAGRTVEKIVDMKERGK